jgi:magnesium transporter
MLINCVAYENGKRLGDIPTEAIDEHLKRPGCFVWVALEDPSAEEMAGM